MMDEASVNSPANRVLVVGGGVGGIRTALDLAEAGRDVVLIDKAPGIGGLMTQLDRTFPTNNCDMCTISPHLSENGRDLHLDIKPLTTISGLEGEAGDFTAEVVSKPRYIDLEKCTACGDCLKAHPECVVFTPGLDPRAPTCMRYPQSTPLAYSIDIEKCENIEEVAKVCKVGAILTDDKPVTQKVHVGGIVLAPGAGLFDPKALGNYGYGDLPNVVTGLDYERIMSASGPTEGQLIRPSDGKQPQKVAWIQCVGSRNINQADAPYCSGACCMYALKEAIVTKERFRDDIETTIFYMDMRTSGKDYELYLNRAQSDFNVRLVRCRPHTIDPLNDNGDLSITYTTDETTQSITEEFDMVVLSAGFKVPEDVAEMGGIMGIDLTEWNFAKTGSFTPIATSRPGIYVCGLFQSPKDIPETMVQASAAAGLVSSHLGPKPDVEIDENLPPERDVTNEEPKIGVFVCDCGENIGGVIDAQTVADEALKMQGVLVSGMNGHGCSSESLKKIETAIERHGLNRIVIGGCSPRTHEGKFQDAARRAGLNKYLVEMANLRDQDTWVHADHPEAATEKAKELIRMAIASSALRRPLQEQTLPVNKDVLVVGGGVTGMTSALSLANQGHRVFLVERSDKLGGMALNVRRTLEGDDVQAFVSDLVEKTTTNDNIQVLTQTLVVDHTGMPGAFVTGVQSGLNMAYRRINHGATIMATGALANRPKEYLLGDHDAVMTQLDIDNLLEDDPDKFKSMQNVVMIQCVGSRTPENPNCSRLCCQGAIKNALRIKELNPGARIIVLNRDIRTYGFQEDYYRKARELGVIFARYKVDNKPVVAADGDKVSVTFHDSILATDVSVSADLLALSTGIVADEENSEDMSMIFRLPRTDDGFYLEDHVKLRPIDLPVPGFLAAGTAHSPKPIGESVAQGQAAAGRVLAMLSRNEINLGAMVAKVDGKKCAACLICVRACPFDVPFINAEGYSEIDPAKCHGCGICAGECPAKAIQLMQYEDDLILAKIDGLLDGILMKGCV